MANIILTGGNTWDTSCIYDSEKKKNQKQINADLQHETLVSFEEKNVEDVPFAEFDNGADGIPVNLTVAVTPVQNLNGQEYPYPDRATNNLIPDGTDTSNGYVNGQYLKSDGTLYTESNWYTSEYFPVTAGETYTWSGNFNPLSPSICFYDSGKNFISAIQGEQGLPKTFTAPTGAVYCRASQGKNFATYGQQMELGSTATTPKPYSNICPITGWTGCEVRHTGANLLGGDALKDAVVASMPSASVSTTNKYVSFASNATVEKAISYPLTGIFKENTQYTFIMTIYKNTGTGSNLRIYYTNGTFDNFPGVSSTTVKETKVFVTPPNKTVYSLRKNNSSGTTRLYYEESGIFEGDLTAQDFEAYQGTTYHISWETEAGTVYGGAMDVTTGVLTVDKETIEIDENTSFTGLDGDANCFFANDILPEGNVLKTSEDEPLFYCNQYKEANYVTESSQSTSRPVFSFFNQSNYLRRVYFRNSNYSTPESFQASLQNNPIQIVSPLATPITYQLTPTEVKTLLLKNLIWGDTGNVAKLTYRAVNNTDEKIALTKAIAAPVLDNMIADTALSANDFRIVGDTLYKITSSIASGGTLTPNTNCVATTICAEITAILNS